MDNKSTQLGTEYSKNDQENAGEMGARETEIESESNSRHVHWGNVRVHTHKLKLGCNPGMLLFGPPLTIDWKADVVQDFPSPEEFYEHYHKGRPAGSAPVYRMTHFVRNEIAAESDSLEDIRAVENEVQMIRQSREQSAKEPNEGSVKEMLLKKRQEREAKKTKKQTGFWGSLFRSKR